MNRSTNFTFNGKLLKQILENIDFNKAYHTLKKKERKTLLFLKTTTDLVFVNDHPESFQCSDADLFKIKDLIPKLSSFANSGQEENMILMCNKFSSEFDQQLEKNNKVRPRTLCL